MTAPNIGRPVPRKEGRDKVTGAARYIDDITFPAMLYGATIRSPAPRGKIRAIVFGEGVNWDEFIIVTARDIPAENAVALILLDQPYEAATRVAQAHLSWTKERAAREVANYRAYVARFHPRLRFEG